MTGLPASGPIDLLHLTTAAQEDAVLPTAVRPLVTPQVLSHQELSPALIPFLTHTTETVTRDCRDCYSSVGRILGSKREVWPAERKPKMVHVRL